MTSRDEVLVREVAHFIRTHKQRILSDWMQAAANLPGAADLSQTGLRDHVPDMLDRLAEAVESGDESHNPLRGLPNLHAISRLKDNYDIREVVQEYRLLRRIIVDLYTAEAGELDDATRARLRAIAAVDDALDRAITNAVDEFASERERTREMFIGILSHDLRQPLHTIEFGAQALWNRAQELDAPTVKTVAVIASSATRMNAMIRDLLDFARGRLAGGLPITRRPLDARVLVERAVEEVAVAHPDRTIVCRPCDHGGTWDVAWDGDRVAQAVSNLLTNALAHGGDPIHVDAFDRGREVSIEIRNAGEIDHDSIAHLFEPFSTGTERHPALGIGLGLGLYIVAEIARAHGGRVTTETGDGSTTFRLALPRGPV